MTPANTNRPSLDPHCYQPLVIDESVLSAEDRHAVFNDALRYEPDEDPWRDWRRHLTAGELRVYDVLAKNYRLGPRTKEFDQQLQLMQTGRRRSFARHTYGGGRRVWYGDGVPPWCRSTEA